MSEIRPDSPDEFFRDRCDWFRMDLMKNEHGSWAIVLVVDEGYGDREHAEDIKKFFAWRVSKALIDVYVRETGEDAMPPDNWFGQSKVREQAAELFWEAS